MPPINRTSQLSASGHPGRRVVRRIPSHILATAGIIIACAACATGGYDAPNTLGVLPPQPPAPLWLGAVRGGTATIGGAPISGAAAVTPSPTPGWTHVLLSLSDVTAGGIYSWSLRSGTCAAQGAVLGPADRYANFSIRADGSGAADAVVPAVLSPSAPYAVVASPVTQGASTSGCADLARGSM
ncbi:MAG: hypothetical protein ABI194_05355 [Gemmatimonadaceae bacterium]